MTDSRPPAVRLGQVTVAARNGRVYLNDDRADPAMPASTARALAAALLAAAEQAEKQRRKR